MSNIQEKIHKVARHGRIFTVTYAKKDGTTRKVNCRLQVRKFLKGGTNNAPSNSTTVCDMQVLTKNKKNGTEFNPYRTLLHDGILKINGEEV